MDVAQFPAQVGTCAFAALEDQDASFMEPRSSSRGGTPHPLQPFVPLPFMTAAVLSPATTRGSVQGTAFGTDRSRAGPGSPEEQLRRHLFKDSTECEPFLQG